MWVYVVLAILAAVAARCLYSMRYARTFMFLGTYLDDSGIRKPIQLGYAFEVWWHMKKPGASYYLAIAQDEYETKGYLYSEQNLRRYADLQLTSYFPVFRFWPRREGPMN